MDQVIKDKMRQEGIVLSEPAMWVKTDQELMHGRLVLTPKRLLFFKNNMENGNGQPSADHLERSLEVHIDLDTINELSQKCLLVDPNILCIVYMQYQEARFSVTDYENWEKAIETQRMKPHVQPAPQVPYKDH